MSGRPIKRTLRGREFVTGGEDAANLSTYRAD